LVTDTLVLPAPATGLAAYRDGVAVRTADGATTWWSPTGTADRLDPDVLTGALAPGLARTLDPDRRPHGSPPYSVTVHGRRVAAIHADRLIVAVPHGGRTRAL
jgi:hypothetical protein